MANPLLPTQQDLQEALRVVRRAKVLVTKLSKDSDHVWLKDKIVNVNRLLLKRHSSHEEVIQEIHSNLLISLCRYARQTAHADIVEFLQSDVFGCRSVDVVWNTRSYILFVNRCFMKQWGYVQEREVTGEVWAKCSQPGVETCTSLCLCSTPFTFHPTALLLSIRSELPFSC